MLIVHHCKTCGQPDYWKDQGGRNTAGDKVDGSPIVAAARRRCCGKGASWSWGPSEAAKRWRTATNEPITEPLEPGGTAGGGSTTCNCDECWALWMQLTGSTRRPRRLAAVPG